MPTATEALDAARSQLGYNGDGDCDNPVTTFGAWAGVQTQWCAEFCSWCLDRAGVPSAGRFGRFDYGEDYCPAWVQSFQNAGRWSTDPAPGHLVFYSWNHDGVADHVGIVESVNADGTITTIEGNTDDPTLPQYQCGNCCRRKNRTTDYVLGYGQPAYSDEETAAAADAQLIPATIVRPGMFELISNQEGRVVACGPNFWCDTNCPTPQQTTDAIAQLQRSPLCINPKAIRPVRDAEMNLLFELYMHGKGFK